LSRIAYENQRIFVPGGSPSPPRCAGRDLGDRLVVLKDLGAVDHARDGRKCSAAHRKCGKGPAMVDTGRARWSVGCLLDGVPHIALSEFMVHAGVRTASVYFDKSPTQAQRVNPAMAISRIYANVAKIARRPLALSLQLVKLALTELPVPVGEVGYRGSLSVSGHSRLLCDCRTSDCTPLTGDGGCWRPIFPCSESKSSSR
jgi:hypothetical protein